MQRIIGNHEPKTAKTARPHDSPRRLAGSATSSGVVKTLRALERTGSVA